MKHIFIINPAAGKGDSENKILPQIIKFVKEKGDDFEIHRSLNKNEILKYVRSKASLGDPIRFYAVGGDGTICDVVSGMVEFGNAELAVIPCGSGNDFVRNFSHTENFLNLEKNVSGSIEYIDVLKWNDSYSLNMLNAGTDCDVVIKSAELRKKGVGGVKSYAQAALSILPNKPSYVFEYLDSNGILVQKELMLIAIGNGQYCGGGFKSCPIAKLNDGLMDIALIKPIHGPLLYKLLLKYRLGTYVNDKKAQQYFDYIQVPEFWIKPIGDINVSDDGEVYKFEETHISVLPKAIKFVVPQGSSLLSK